MSGFILGNAVEWLFGEQIVLVFACDIRCDVSLKIRLFYILITNIMSNNNKYWFKKKTKVNSSISVFYF